MRYFTIYMTPGGNLRCLMHRQERYAFSAFDRVTNAKNKPVWAFCMMLTRDSQFGGFVKQRDFGAITLCKYHGDLLK